MPDTEDAIGDLVVVGVPVFRSLVLEHPALYRIAFQRIAPNFPAGPEVVNARERALAGLLGKVERLAEADLLGEKTVLEAAVEFNAMLEGLANAELRGTILRNLPAGDEERTWQEVLTTVARGFRASGYEAGDRAPSQVASRQFRVQRAPHSKLGYRGRCPRA